MGLTAVPSRLSEYQDKLTPGYIRVGESEAFAWTNRSSTWFMLTVLEGGELRQFGWTGSLTQKKLLRQALEELAPGAPAKLYGIWHGANKTHVFDLELDVAKARLLET